MTRQRIQGRKGTLAVLLAAAVLMAACGSKPPAVQETPLPKEAPAAFDSSEAKRTFTPADLDKRVVSAQNAFGLRLHGQLAAEHPAQNLFVSPYSAAAALSMVYHGAEGTTRQEIGRVLQAVGLNLEEWNRGSRVLKDLLEHSGAGNRLNIANSIWLRKDFEIREDFVKRNREEYGAEVSELDFTKDSAADLINEWVRKRTEEKIQGIVKAPIPEDLIMYLINAVYFHGTWSLPFLKEDTVPAPFYASPDARTEVKMMKRSGRFAYQQKDGYQAIRLPYRGEKISMLVVLPDEGWSLAKLQEQLGKDEAFWTRQMPYTEGTIELPRFKLEASYDLIPALKELGMREAFVDGAAKFSGISEEPVKISEVAHKSYLQVDEEGTEAAAVTSIGITKSTSVSAVHPFHMTVNRPFLLAIQSSETGSLLFLGSIYKPEE
ncbi:proteinase inhibitor I4, serpin [Paenibacillus mucilaginosus 3016]|uniref:Proteinase inhibitor I4, serpin n=1 Tax=Paenibacillus mucilaginosus 3016 TaxID=1116391 RepID=H6NBF0_9BACL|nr:serpin family protein [Paenibacillus mucilaginosus]AFC32896.1 proteinase inhibitor I4, serpin [Paenibacillus mucilaginosus 3016]WFA21347.1 serpin family protein [Paenibacillus mucilaginosus]